MLAVAHRVAMLLAAAVTVHTPGVVLDGDASKPMPLVGFGTCCRKSAKGEALINSTRAYLADGGRLVDTAQIYNNHLDLKVALATSSVARSDVWITSKVNTFRFKSREDALQSIRDSTSDLGVAFIDLMLIHGIWDTISTAQAVDVWRGLIDAKQLGLVKHIGVSNFDLRHIQRLIAETGVTPVALQLEYHPWVTSEAHELVAWGLSHGMAITAYGSLGGSRNAGSPNPHGDMVSALARTHSVSPSALLLRWALNRGVAVIPGATSYDHIHENLHLPPVDLSRDELQRLESPAARPPYFTSWTVRVSYVTYVTASLLHELDGV